MGGITEGRPPMNLSGRCVCDSDPQFVEEKHIHAGDLVVGALENAFQECVSTSRQALDLLPQAVPLSLPATCGVQSAVQQLTGQAGTFSQHSVLRAHCASSLGSASDLLLHSGSANPEQSCSISAKLHPGDAFFRAR